MSSLNKSNKIGTSTFNQGVTASVIFIVIILFYFWRIFIFGARFGNVDFLRDEFRFSLAEVPWSTISGTNLQSQWNYHINDNLIGYLYSEYLISTIQKKLSIGFWDPFTGNGMPLLAKTQPMALYFPAVILRQFVEPIDTFTFISLFHLWLFGFGCYSLARVYGVSNHGAIISGVSGLVGGRAITWASWGGSLGTAAWGLIALAGIALVAQGHRRTGATALVVGIAGQFYAGMPLIWFFNFISCVVTSVIHLWTAGDRRRYMMTLGASVFLSALMSVAVWFPFLELYSLAYKPPFPFREMSGDAISVPIRELPSLLIANWLGKLPEIWTGWFNPGERFMYFGPGVGTLLLSGLLRGFRQRLLPIFACFSFWGVVIFGLSAGEYVVENLGLARFSLMRSTVMFSACAAVGAGSGWDCLKSGRAIEYPGQIGLWDPVRLIKIVIATLTFCLFILMIFSEPIKVVDINVDIIVAPIRMYLVDPKWYLTYGPCFIECIFFSFLFLIAFKFGTQLDRSFPVVLMVVVMVVESYWILGDYNTQLMRRSDIGVSVRESTIVSELSHLFRTDDRFTTWKNRPNGWWDWHQSILMPNIAQIGGFLDSRAYESLLLRNYVEAVSGLGRYKVNYELIKTIIVPDYKNVVGNHISGINGLVTDLPSESSLLTPGNNIIAGGQGMLSEGQSGQILDGLWLLEDHANRVLAIDCLVIKSRWNLDQLFIEVESINNSSQRAKFSLQDTCTAGASMFLGTLDDVVSGRCWIRSIRAEHNSLGVSVSSQDNTWIDALSVFSMPDRAWQVVSGSLKGNRFVLRSKINNPRAYIVHRVVSVGARDNLVEKMYSDNVGEVLRSAFMYEAEYDDTIAALNFSNENHEDMVPEVTCSDLAPTIINCSIEKNSKDGLVVLTDNYYPGWTAAVDGVPAKIYRVNHTNRGVFVRAGATSVGFSFEPSYWWLQVGCVVLSFCISLGCLARWWRGYLAGVIAEDSGQKPRDKSA